MARKTRPYADRMIPRARTLLALAATAFLAIGGGCQTSRLDQLRSKADKVDSSLKKERNRVLASSQADRDARLSRLSGLYTTKSMTDIALAAVPFVVEEPQRDMAYDVLEEAYDTIDWNIPLGPNDPQRPMPTQLQGSTLRLN
jgi:hypothetical protein